MSDEQLTSIANKLMEIDPELGFGFIQSSDKYNYLKNNEEVLRNNSKFTDVYNTYKDIVGDRMKRLETLMKDKELYTKDITPAEMQSFLSKNPDIGASDVNEYITKQREYKNYYENERKKQAGRIERKQQIEGKSIRNPEKNWSFFDRMLSSDYEKQRYIDDPNQAIFGADAPGLFQAPETRWGAIGDLGAGAAAAAADVITTPVKLTPGGFILNTLAGPSIRAGRDIVHERTDSPYQKEWAQIGKDFKDDVGLNTLTLAFANARRLSRGIKGVTEESAKQIALKTETDNIAKEIKELEALIKNNKPISEIIQHVDAMPATEFKKEVQESIMTGLKNPDKTNIMDDLHRNIVDYKDYIKPDVSERAKILVDKGEYPLNDYLLRRATTPPMTKVDNISYNLNKLGDAINEGRLGGIIGETGYTAGGVRESNTAPRNETTMERKNKTKIERMLLNQQKNDYKQSEPRFWRAGFAPKKIDGDPLWEAYKEWYKEEYGRDVEDK